MTVLPLLLTAAVLASAAPAEQGDIDSQEQAAFETAVSRVAPSVVRIETVGGLETVQGTLFGTGPTTGWIVDPGGYIVSSAFNFVNKPSSILVRLADGVRRPARLVATDHARMLVLLKIDAPRPLPTCPIVPKREMRVGQWTIALGRTFASERPNMAVGILSALNRIWGKAIQTDAAVSPNNYGGPLVDIRGRVLGVLVPLSPETADEMAGAEWYDSGIGFAIPAEDIQQVLPRLKKGEDLRPGLLGVSLKGTDLYTGVPTVAACRQKSPAAVAGIKTGDQIVEIDGRAITRGAEVKEELGRRYAGQSVRIAVMRGKERIERSVELAAKLEPFQHGFLGVLPMRTSDPQGVVVRFVYPKSPADVAGIATGDVLVSANGKTVRSRGELATAVCELEPGNELALDLRRAGQSLGRKVVLAAPTEDLPPADLPPATQGIRDQGLGIKTTKDAGAGTVKPKTPAPNPAGSRLKIPEFPNDVWCYVPESRTETYGLVVWLHAPGSFDWKRALDAWKPLCDRDGLILVAPKSSDPTRWLPNEANLVARLVVQIMTTHPVDAARVVIHGYEGGGTMAFLAGFRNREFIRAVAAVEAAPLGSPPENDALHWLSVYVAWAGKSPAASSVDRALYALRRAKIPVTEKKLGETPRYLDAQELAELARWIDTLDRI
jgi:serine protease Do